MSKERIVLKDVSMLYRLMAALIDTIVVIIIAIICYFGAELEYELIWSKIIALDPQTRQLLIILWFIIAYPIYYVLISGLTQGQTVGKLLLGIKVVTKDGSATKGMYKLHLKRFFFLKGETRVVKEIDKPVKELM